jgi:hypothetical protein
LEFGFRTPLTEGGAERLYLFEFRREYLRSIFALSFPLEGLEVLNLGS